MESLNLESEILFDVYVGWEPSKTPNYYSKYGAAQWKFDAPPTEANNALKWCAEEKEKFPYQDYHTYLVSAGDDIRKSKDAIIAYMKGDEIKGPTPMEVIHMETLTRYE